MEAKNGFDLEGALQEYREDCAGLPGISADDARELESDLRERVADLLKSCGSKQEAFLRAVREIGSPAELAREFARENPLAVWRERLFWMAWAGFAVSVWGFLTNGVLMWLHRELLLHVPWGTWMVLTAQMPLLVLAVLLVRGRFDRQFASLQSIVRNRARLGLVAGGALVVAGHISLFGPSPMQLPAKWSALTLLFLLDYFSWPLVLLVLGVALYRPHPGGKTKSSACGRSAKPAWHARVFWMAFGGLMVGFWQSVSWCGVAALFYSGNNERPFKIAPLLLMVVHKLIVLSPLALAVHWYRRRVRAGQGIGTATPNRAGLLVAIPAVLCVWAGRYALSSYMGTPHDVAFPWRDFWAMYATNLQWLWPMGLALLVFWLAPKRNEAADLAGV